MNIARFFEEIFGKRNLQIQNFIQIVKNLMVTAKTILAGNGEKSVSKK